MAGAPVWRFEQVYYVRVFKAATPVSVHGGSARLPSIDSVLIFSMVNHALFCLAAPSKVHPITTSSPQPLFLLGYPLLLVAEGTQKWPDLSLSTHTESASRYPRSTGLLNDDLQTPERTETEHKTHILDIPHARGDVHVLAQDFLDLFAAGGLHDDGAAGKGEGRGVG